MYISTHVWCFLCSWPFFLGTLRVIGATAATRTSREERRKTTIKPCGTRKQQPTTGIQQLTPIANPDVERPQETFNNYIVIQLYYVLFRPNLEDLEMFLVYPCDYIHALYAHYTHQYYTMLYIHILIIHTYIHSNTYICTSMYVYIYTYIEGPPPRMHFSYADAAPKVGPGGSAVWAQANWQPNAFSTTELWGNQLQQIMFGKACGSKTGKGCRTPMRANSKETTLPETIAPQTRM